MAEFVEKRVEDMIPELEQMERIKLFDKNEIRNIAKKLKEYEYKIQRRSKSKEDYLRYIQYEMDLLKLVRQRRDKFGISQKKSDIDHTIANKMNHLYKDAIFKFQDDIRFWIAYMKFCKHVKFQSNVTHMLGRMLQVHQDKPKCWHIAAKWELEENNNKETARQFLFRGLHVHPTSQLLYIDAFKLELDDDAPTNENKEEKEESEEAKQDNDMSLAQKRAYIIYQQASKNVKDIKFIVEILNILKDYKNTEKLQTKVICDMIEEYAHEPLMWDTMARRELEGLVQPTNLSDDAMEIDVPEQTTLRERITACNKVYQTAVKKMKTEEIWSYYIDCLIEINDKEGPLPNFKRKLLKIALSQGYQARKLKEKHYLHWINILSNDKSDADTDKKLLEVLETATEHITDSIGLWHARYRFLLFSDKEDEAAKVFKQATKILGDKSLPLWKLRLVDAQTRNPSRIEDVFRDALQAPANIAQDMKITYIEWLVLKKGIEAARKVYNDVCLQPPFSAELHKKMYELELMQPKTSIKHARKPHELAMLQFGKDNVKVWINAIIFEMKHGDPKKVGDIHRRAVKTLEPQLTTSFITEYSLMKAKSDTSTETH